MKASELLLTKATHTLYLRCIGSYCKGQTWFVMHYFLQGRGVSSSKGPGQS